MSDRTVARTGWGPRSLVALAMAALSALCVTVFLYEDRAAAAGAEGLWAFIGGTVIGHSLGGGVAGAALAGLFGRAGTVGWALALVGGVAASLVGGLIGGALNAVPSLLSGASAIEEVIRLGAAILVTPLAIASAPWLGAIWLAAVGAVHVVVRRSRAAHAL